MTKRLHPELTAGRRAQLARRGEALFGAGRFFAAHECWEEIWRSTDPAPRDLWQGLVQLAAAFHHLRARGRPDVARRVMAKARRRLLAVPPGAHAVDLPAVLTQVDRWLEWLAAAGTGEAAVAEPPAVLLSPGGGRCTARGRAGSRGRGRRSPPR